MKKQIFKVGDRVFDIRFGWGEVITTKCTGCFNSDNILQVLFKNPDNSIWYTKDGLDYKWSKQPLLSFTEYTLEGFSQERPINYDDYIGKWGTFWDDGDKSFV